jgi:hypothetical protein
VTNGKAFYFNASFPRCYGAPYSRLQGFYCSRWMGRPAVVSLPFPFSPLKDGKEGW